MRRVWADGIGLSSLLLLVTIFFFRLFYPVPSLIVTPDYGRSDAWHFSFATKYVLSESLKSNSLPLWRNDIGDGFPLFAEGQTGALFLPNIVLFRFLPPVIAYNTALMFAVLLMGIGMYVWSRIMKFSVLGSWFVAVSVTFSGLSMTQLTHITLLQGMSMLPVIAALSIAVTTLGPYPWTGFLAFAVAQQIAAGFPQATFLTLVISSVFVGYFSLSQKKWKSCAFWIIGILLGIAGGAAQILPSWEFLKAGTDPGGFAPTISTMYSMPIKHLISFILPFALGNPKYGTYPPFYAFDGSIFWENTAYIGILPILLSAAGLLFLRKDRFIIFLLLLSVSALMLAGGKYAPTYILFSVWPLTLFRVPARFLWIASIAIAMIGAVVIDRVSHQARTQWMYLLIGIALLLHGAQLLNTWWSYHLIEPASIWMNTPTLSASIGSERIITIGHGVAHNRIMTGSGWSNAKPYRFLREGIAPDSNMLWHVSQHNVYAGRYLKRPSLTDSLLSDAIKTDEHTATISAVKFLDFFSIRHVLSFLPLDAPGLIRTAHRNEGDTDLTLYTNPHALPRAYLTHEATAAATLTEAIHTLTGPNFTPGESVLLEQHEIIKNPRLTKFLTRTDDASRILENNTVAWEQDEQTAIRLTVEASADALLILTDTYYPGWHARIDGEATQLYAANLSQRAIMVPKGIHTVTFFYRPVSLVWGLIISAISALLTVILMIVLKLSGGAHIQKKVQPPVSRHPRIRGR
ncbi:MAG: YfhO family protein [Patescibacteria group bacterium]